ncbi:phage terminase large subunit [Rhodoplanes roseus]|uniref:Terminase large subunit gp17-like C-terminal domain-containing protein n=1 Tax=Rhodoplanes roseus TaxID=29409 RepID=A0A327L2S6_9BRAD|nr:phage terminase large subunit [Rhodoplanes roseus]RAI43792.1 hypothetical protein CH341_12445 [Rhodoplanes roseus]
MNTALREAVAAYRTNFPLFATKAFNIVNPGTAFSGTMAFLAMAHALSEVAAGRTRRLLITVPPRSGKSLLASIALPAFVLGRDPTRRVICASYSGDLAAKLARDSRMLMSDHSYGQLFPGTKLTGKNTETEMETAHGGFRFATSVGGTLLGRGGNFIVIDDAMKPDEASSQSSRERVWDWFTGTVGSRLDNKAEGAIVVVMQRLHPEDLVGLLLDRGGWDHLCIPAIADTDQILSVGGGRVHHRKAGDVLDPVREPRHVLDQIRAELGSRTFEAQYQQQPVPDEGARVNWSWFRTYDRAPDARLNDRLVVSWDTATKDRDVNDYTVGIVARVTAQDEVFILEVIRERLIFPALRSRIREVAHRHPGTVSLIEDAGSGTALIQDLRNVARVIGIRPVGEKIQRFDAVTPHIEAGRVHLPKQAPWLAAFQRELLTFPAGAHDDQVDALSQLLGWLNNRYHGSYVGTYGMN